MHLIIDADPIVYRCGFAAETPTYHLVVEDTDTGAIDEVVFAPYDGKTAGARMQAYLANNPQYVVLEKEKVIHAEPENHAHEAVRTQLYSIEKECRDHFGCGGFTSITTILSGPDNYRERLATIVPYKGNRDPTHKPVWYQSIRNQLTSEFGACVVSGREADDECSILGWRHIRSSSAFCIATIDKDLDQIPGNHYNYLKQVFYAQSQQDADLFFWQQVLSGDATDGIPGCYKIGEQRAASILNSVVSAGYNATAPRPDPAVDTGTHEGKYIAESNPDARRIWETIVATYEASLSKANCPYVGRNTEAVALETARLVYLQQKEGELWMPPPGPHGLLEEYRDE